MNSLTRRIAVVVATFLVVGAAQICWAHAILVESTPKINSTAKGPDLDITLRFNVRIDGDRSRVLLVSSEGTASQLTLAKQSKPDILQMHASGNASRSVFRMESSRSSWPISVT